MKRSASLDFLRGAAAFAVAVPHYLTANAPFSPTVEAVAVASVEVFFVLSGFVLAPQIVDWVVGRPWRNLGVFLARRWMRTIPPYVAALVVVALMTGNLFTADALRYLVYVENLIRSSNAVDFYPVAWSLAVEEWFYLLFAPLLFLAGRALGRSDRRVDVAFAILFVLVVAALRAFASPADWDLNVRRVTLFRIDSIVWGFLLYLALERRPLLAPNAGTGGRGLAALAVAFAAAAALEFRVATLALEGVRVAQAGLSLRFRPVRRRGGRRFPGGRRPVQGAPDRGAELLPRAHFVLGLSLPHRHRDGAEAADRRLAARPATRALCRGDRGLLDRLLARLRAADPGGAAGLSPKAARGRGRREPRRRRRRADGLRPRRSPWASVGAAALARDAFMANAPWTFYPALIATAGLAVALAERAGRFAASLGVVCAGVRPLRARPACGGRRLSVLDRRADRRLARQPDLFLSRRARKSGRLRDVVVLLPQRMDPGRRHSGRDREARSAERASVRLGSRRNRADVRRHHPHQFRRLPRAGDRRGEGRPLPHRRARRVADVRADPA